MASLVPKPSRSTTIRRRLGKQTKPRYIKQCWTKWRLNKKDSYQVRVTTWLNWPTKNMCLRMKRLMQSVSSSPSSKSSSETKTIRYKSTRSLTTKRFKLLLSRPQIWRKQVCRSLHRPIWIRLICSHLSGRILPITIASMLDKCKLWKARPFLLSTARLSFKQYLTTFTPTFRRMARKRAQIKSRPNSYLAALSCPIKCNCQTCFRVAPPTSTSMNCMFQIRWFRILRQRKACRSLLTTKLSDLLHRVELKSRRSWWQGRHRKLNSYSKLQPLRRVYKRVLADKALWHRWVSQKTQR